MEKGSQFGERYRAWRKARGVSNYRVEKLTGYSRSNLSHIENGSVKPSDELLEKLASVPELGLSLETLKGWRALDDYPELAGRLEPPSFTPADTATKTDEEYLAYFRSLPPKERRRLLAEVARELGEPWPE